MKTTLHLLFITTAILTISAACRAQTNFSGNWKLDTNKTSFGQAPKFVLSHALRVTQTTYGLVVDRTNLTNDLQERHYIQHITFDGKSSHTVTISGNNETDSLSRSNNDRALTIIMNTISPENNPIANTTEIWTLSDDGKTLIVDRKVEQSSGGYKYEIKGYYNKN